MGGGMKILTRQQIGPAAWDAFCLTHPGAWFLWTSAYLDYQAARGTQELSFGVVDGETLMAICPLFLEERDGVRSFTMEGHPGPGPLGYSPDAAYYLLHEVNRLVEAERVARVAFRGSPFLALATIQQGGNVDCKHGEGNCCIPGYGHINWHTQIIDLTQSEADLHAGVRKSYTSLINHVTRTHEIVVDDKGDLLKAFKRLHFGQAGRQTRPDRMWEIQREWCEAGNGLIVAAMRWNVAVACTYWILWRGCAYYASSASINPNTTHALMWRAMLELKARGVGKLEMGWIDYPGDPPGLGKFKTGFGGEAVPVIAAERRFAR